MDLQWYQFQNTFSGLSIEFLDEDRTLSLYEKVEVQQNWKNKITAESSSHQGYWHLQSHCWCYIKATSGHTTRTVASVMN